ncbi:MAG: DNA polymerase IV [Clostridia bacterium]|nr:DNA polymerase IV [Clostridia bacterium]
MGDRVILHIDCNSFYASVEQVFRPELADVPMAVCGDPEGRRGIILAKNEKAKAYGVATAETIWQAKRKCPDLVLVPPRMDEYRRFSRRINAIYAEYTDMVEPFSLDESWLDVTASQQLFGDGKTIADTIRRRVREEIGVTVSVGVSFNKVFAKLGSDYKKPDATTVFLRKDMEKTVWTLPVNSLLFVGRSAANTLAKSHIETIGDLARTDRDLLVRLLGKLGDTLSDYARGLDDAPVAKLGDVREVKSVGNGMTFRRDLVTEEDIRVGLHVLCDSVAHRLRRSGLRAWTVQVTIKDTDLKSITRQTTLSRATDLSSEMLTAAMTLTMANRPKAIRMLTVTVSGLTDQTTGEQISLFADEQLPDVDRQRRLEHTLDRLRDRYGWSSVRPGATLQNDLGIAESAPRGAEDED